MVLRSDTNFSLVSVGVSPELPQNLALIGIGADATIAVELWNLNGVPVLWNDGSNNLAVVELTVPAAAASSLAAIAKAAGYNVAENGLPGQAHGGCARVLAGTFAFNFGGSDDGNGANGFANATLAPLVNSPRRAGAGDLLFFGRYH